MVSLLKLLPILIEWVVQWKRRDDQAKKQERLNQARNDPAAYLRNNFGRVQRESAEDVHGGGTGTDRHDSQ